VSLSYDLAKICVAAEDTAVLGGDPPNLIDVRDQFENMALREEVARAHASRLADLAKLRASREDTSLGGHLETGYKRLLPIPHTLGEAAVRGPATALGGILGYGMGKKYEVPDATDVKKLFSPEGGLHFAPAGKDKKVSPIVSALQTISADAGKTGVKSKKLVSLLKKMQLMSPDDLADLLREKRLPGMGFNAGQKAIRAEMEKVLGEKGTALLPQEVRNLLAQTGKDKGVLSSAFKPWRLGGAALGVGAAGLLSGLPFAARALYQKREGGEAAARAKAKLQQALAEAENASARREELLRQIEGPAPK